METTDDKIPNDILEGIREKVPEMPKLVEFSDLREDPAECLTPEETDELFPASADELVSLFMETLARYTQKRRLPKVVLLGTLANVQDLVQASTAGMPLEGAGSFRTRRQHAAHVEAQKARARQEKLLDGVVPPGAGPQGILK